MEARFTLLLLSLILVPVFCLPTCGQRYQVSSENFVVYAPDPGFARKASQLAEQYRKELSLDWLGYEIETWREKCPIVIRIGRQAFGETSFAFIQNQSGRGEPISWQMKIEGPPDRLLDAVLPHEITHTIFATHFGQPLPRWADEGACTTVEHESERAKNHRMLLSFLTGSPSRGIPFNKMFTMKQYPRDILPLYAQGYSVARYLIAQKGRQHFVQFVGRGISTETSNFDTRSWDSAVKEFYGYDDLSDFQISWMKWVRSGSPDVTPASAIVAATPATESVSPPQLLDPNRTFTVADAGKPAADSNIAATDTSKNKIGESNSWYARQSRAKQAVPAATETIAPAAPAATASIAPIETAPAPGLEFRPGSLKRFEELSGNAISQLLEDSHSESADAKVWR